MKTYWTKGSYLNEPRTIVWAAPDDGQPPYRLNERQDLISHSPDGFSWGYAGSGPAQLALALLADIYDDTYALEHHQLFKFKVIANLPQSEGWKLQEGEIRAAMTNIEQKGIQALNGR